MNIRNFVLLLGIISVTTYHSAAFPADDPSTGMSGENGTPGDTPCHCYCLAAWGAAIAAPFVPKLPTTVSTHIPGNKQTETETGEEFWTATANDKTYQCGTVNVLNVAAVNLNLVHNTYSRSRTRSRTLGFQWGWPPVFWNPWGAWTGWTPFANTGNLGDAVALATSAPPATPHCPAVGIACP